VKLVTVASQKGGTGKTTLCGHLAVAAERAGAGPVALVDTDPQGSLSDWSNARALKTPHFAQADVATLAQDLDHLRERGIELVIVDTPPAVSYAIMEVVQLSDLILIPVRPSPHDLAAAGATADLVESLHKPLVFVVNSASPRARITAEAAIALSQHGTVASTIVSYRSDFASSMIDGRTVMELPRSKRSTAEIEGLWSYIESRLGIRDTAPAPIDIGRADAFSGHGSWVAGERR